MLTAARFSERNRLCDVSMKIGSEEKLHWPRLLEEEVIHLAGEQSGWLLDGYDVRARHMNLN